MSNHHRHAPKPPPAFHIITKPRGALCNLACQYCYFRLKEHLYPDSTLRMTDDVLKHYTRQYIQSQRTSEVTFIWQGGEPLLMGLEFYEKALAFQHQFARPGQAIHNALQTNGTLLNHEWAAFFHRHHFLLGLSLDGPAVWHDAYRVDKGGQPTHAQALRGLQVLKHYPVDFNILCCVHQANMHFPLEVYRYLRDELAARFIQFISYVCNDLNDLKEDLLI